MNLFDTHCHIQESEETGDLEHDATQKKWHTLGNPLIDDLVANAKSADVTRLMCVGCTLEDSRRAIEAAKDRQHVWASIGIHPHEAQNHLNEPGALEAFAALATQPKVKAVGECGLDYYYDNSPRAAQEKVLRYQIELALEHNLPMIFHVREAFDDFWSIFDSYVGIRGVIHSFTATRTDLDQILQRGLYVGLNGIMTFTKDAAQLEAAKAVPLERMVLETDAPFLTPKPFRGTICEPKHVRAVAEFLAQLRGDSLADLAQATTTNAQMLFDTE